MRVKIVCIKGRDCCINLKPRYVSNKDFDALSLLNIDAEIILYRSIYQLDDRSYARRKLKEIKNKICNRNCTDCSYIVNSTV